MSLKKLALALAISSGAVAAHAAVVTQSTALVMETTEINQTHSINRFDAALGTLNGVTITFDGRVLSSASLLNEAAQTQVFGFVSSENFFLTGPGSIFQTLQAPLFNHSPAPIASGQLIDLGTQDLSDSLTFTATDLSAFIGTGAVDFLCTTAISNTQTGGGGNILIEQTTTAGCGLNVVYDYTPGNVGAVPEPGSLALLGVAALGGVAVSRRRRR